MPPLALTYINGIETAFGSDLPEIAQKTAYDVYVPVSIEWIAATSQKKRLISLRTSPWDIIALEISATTDFGKPDMVVVSAAVRKLDVPSPFTGLTANATTEENAFAREVLRQFLEISTGFDAEGATCVVGPSAINTGSRWIDSDTAYIHAAGTEAIPSRSESMPGVYTIGPHNLKSPYEFTSIEAAVANADALLFEWFGRSEYAPTQALTLRFALLAILVVVIFGVIAKHLHFRAS